MMNRIVKFLKRFAIYLAVITALFTGALIVYAFRVDSQNKDFTTINTGYTGTKALYLLAEKMGYKVERFEKPARFLPDGGVLVAIEPEAALINDALELKYLGKWLENGNTMIIIVNKTSSAADYDILGTTGNTDAEKGPENYVIYTRGKGGIIFADDSNAYTNYGLRSINSGISFIRLVDNLNSNRLLFNEYYHGISDGRPLLLDILGERGEIIVVQALILLLVFLVSRAVRFGKPVIMLENIKRKENENLYALANIYSRAKAGHIVVEAALTRFKALMGIYLGFGSRAENNEIIFASSADKRLSGYNIKGLINGCESYIAEGGTDEKRMLGLTAAMEKIRREIDL